MGMTIGSDSQASPKVRNPAIVPMNRMIAAMKPRITVSMMKAKARRDSTPSNSSGAVLGSGRSMRELLMAKTWPLAARTQDLGGRKSKPTTTVGLLSAELPRCLERKIGQHGLGAGTLEGPERLHHRRFAVDRPGIARKLDHRVLAAHLIGE